MHWLLFMINVLIFLIGYVLCSQWYCMLLFRTRISFSDPHRNITSNIIHCYSFTGIEVLSFWGYDINLPNDTYNFVAMQSRKGSFIAIWSYSAWSACRFCLLCHAAWNVNFYNPNNQNPKSLHLVNLTPPPPLYEIRDCLTTAADRDTPFHEFLLSSLTHLLIPSLRKSDHRLRGHMTFCTRTSAQNLPKICILHMFVYKTHGNYWFS